jgi:hypothetical protein
MTDKGLSVMQECSPERGGRVVNPGAVLRGAVKPALEVGADAVVDSSGVSFYCIIWQREAIEVEPSFVGAED